MNESLMTVAMQARSAATKIRKAALMEGELGFSAADFEKYKKLLSESRALINVVQARLG